MFPQWIMRRFSDPSRGSLTLGWESVGDWCCLCNFCFVFKYASKALSRSKAADPPGRGSCTFNCLQPLTGEVGNHFQPEGHILFWSTFQRPHSSGGSNRWKLRCTHMPLSVIYPGKSDAWSEFMDTFQPDKNIQIDYRVGPQRDMMWGDDEWPGHNSEGHIGVCGDSPHLSISTSVSSKLRNGGWGLSFTLELKRHIAIPHSICWQRN